MAKTKASVAMAKEVAREKRAGLKNTGKVNMTKKTKASKLETLAVKLASAEIAIAAAHANIEKELKALGHGTVVTIGGKTHKVVHGVSPSVYYGDGEVIEGRHEWRLRRMISPEELALMGHPIGT